MPKIQGKILPCASGSTYVVWHFCGAPKGCFIKVLANIYCIVLYSIIYIAPLNSHRQTEAILVRLAPRKETSFKK